MKRFFIVATIAIAMCTSCKDKASTETENVEVPATEATEQVDATTDSIQQAEQAKIDAEHGHSH